MNALLRRELTAASVPAIPALAPGSVGGDPEVLTSFTAWLVVNSMRSERVQFNALCMQNLANIWRKNALRELMAEHARFELGMVEQIPDRSQPGFKSKA